MCLKFERADHAVFNGCKPVLRWQTEEIRWGVNLKRHIFVWITEIKHHFFNLILHSLLTCTLVSFHFLVLDHKNNVSITFNLFLLNQVVMETQVVLLYFQVVETIAKLHIVMEYAGGGELFNKISGEGRMPEPEARTIFAQVVAAIEHMVIYL